MTWELAGLDTAAAAEEELQQDQYRFVVSDATTGHVRRPDSATETPLGVLQDKPAAAGRPAVVRVDGFSKIVAAEQVTMNAEVAAEYVSAPDAGKAYIPTAEGTDHIRGIVVEPAGAEDALATIRLVDYLKVIPA